MNFRDLRNIEAKGVCKGVGVGVKTCFNVQPDIFALINCCVVALIVFSSDILAGSADSLY